MIAPRSVLFVPAVNARALEKARGLDCDAVVIDLEDAVGPDRKVDARRAAVEALAGDWGEKTVAVRVNAADTPWGADDLQALAQARPGAAVLPKVGSAREIAAAVAALGPTPVWAMIETLAGVLDMAAIGSADGVGALILGQNDLAAEMGCRPGVAREPLHLAMSLIVSTARLRGLFALDGVFNALEDGAGFEVECRQGRAFGFHGKTLIHPSQIAAANTAFSPDADEIAWAEAVVAAYAAPGATDAGVIRVGGRMVERLHLDEARRMLQRR